MKKGVYLLPFILIVLFLILLKTSFYFREGFYDSNTSKIIVTIAGTGTAGYSGDGGVATSANINSVFAIAVDSSENVYIADTGNNRIRKITASTGLIITIAGTGTKGFSGDEGPATNANLSSPWGVAVSNSRNIYIADTQNHRIRKIDTNGKITTIAGSAEIGYDPIKIIVDSSENLYVSNYNTNIVRKITSTGIITTIAGTGTAGYSGDGGLATNAKLNNPWGIAVDSAGNIYIADTQNHRIRKITSSTGIITTIAGTGTSGFSGDEGPATNANISTPWGVALDSAGNVYITDTGNQRIRMINTQGIITTIAGNGNSGYSGNEGAISSSVLNSSLGIAIDSLGNIYIIDSGNNRIRKIMSPLLQAGNFYNTVLGGFKYNPILGNI